RSLLGSVLALGELIEFAQDLLPIGIRSPHRLPFATDRSFEGVAHLIAHGFRAVDGCSSQFGIPGAIQVLNFIDAQRWVRIGQPNRSELENSGHGCDGDRHFFLSLSLSLSLSVSRSVV